MQVLTAWVSNIIMLMLLAGIIEMLLPDSSFQKYIRLVIGMLLILSMLSPLLHLMKLDMNTVIAGVNLSGQAEGEKIKNSIQDKKTEIQASQAAYILEQMAVPLKNKVKEELNSSYGLAITSLSLQASKETAGQEFDYQDITAARVVLERAEGQAAISGVKEVSVTVDGTHSKSTGDQSSLPEGLAQWLADQWQLKREQIILVKEGGE